MLQSIFALHVYNIATCVCITAVSIINKFTLLMMAIQVRSYMG